MPKILKCVCLNYIILILLSAEYTSDPTSVFQTIIYFTHQMFVLKLGKQALLIKDSKENQMVRY